MYDIEAILTAIAYFMSCPLLAIALTVLTETLR